MAKARCMAITQSCEDGFTSKPIVWYMGPSSAGSLHRMYHALSSTPSLTKYLFDEIFPSSKRYGLREHRAAKYKQPFQFKGVTTALTKEQEAVCIYYSYDASFE